MTASAGRHIVVLTGAGISKESGLSTFRDAGGIWAKVRIEDVATPDAFARDPASVHRFYDARRRRLASGAIRPNAAHVALARLEGAWPADVTVVTQNIDDLHERAGSRNLVHMHGELLKARCSACGVVVPCTGALGTEETCRECAATGAMRPHVVWFGEMPLELERIDAALDACATFVSIGTSGNVYPAAGFVDRIRSRNHVHAVELNLEPSEGAGLFDETVYGPATEVVPAFVARFLGAGGRYPRSQVDDTK